MLGIRERESEREREKEGDSVFSVESFLSHSAATFHRESFSVSLISGIEKEKVYG